MTVRYAVTFEFETRPPLTHRGVMRASGEAVCARRAIQAAKKACKPVNWTSMNIVLLERLPEVEAGTRPTAVLAAP